ncbi:nucleolar complex protein 2 homolog [Photinus pyralis]|nr:nucleolar complex protein 2 homolog [Photinus pyralis]
MVKISKTTKTQKAGLKLKRSPKVKEKKTKLTKPSKVKPRTQGFESVSMSDSENLDEFELENDTGENVPNDNSDLDEIKSHKESLKKLQTTDPEFYKFLEENDKKLLQFNISDDEDQEDAVPHKPETELEVASDESDFEAEDEDQATTEGPQKVTLRLLKKWQSDLQVDKTKNTIAHVIHAFHAALLRVSNAEEEVSDYKVEGSAVFNGVIQLCVLELSVAIRKFLGLKSTKIAPHKCKKFPKLKTLLQMYFNDLLKILGSVTSTNILNVLLKHLHHMLPLLQSFRKSCKLIVKKLIYLWGTSDDVVRVLCFFCILRLTTTNQVYLLDTVLKAMYMTYIVNSKFVSVNTLSSINFMKRSLVEMFSIDVGTSYQHIFLYIRQLAIHLRTAITVRKTENIQTVYNWQFINSLKLFGAVLSANYDKPEIQPLVYPFVQVCLGTLKLVPTTQYFPLRFQIVQVLTDFSKSTGVFIPILPFILEVLSIHDFNKKAKIASKKPLNLTCLLRFSNSQMTENGFKDAVIDQTYASVLEYLESQSHSIAFPDLSLFTILQLKKFLDTCTVSGYLKKMKQLLEKIQQNNAFIEKERKSITFELTDFDKIAAWETNVRNKGTPLSVYYASWDKIRTVKKNKEMTNTSDISDYQLPTVRKIKKERSGNSGELFPSDSESEELKFGSEDDGEESIKHDTKKRKKRKSKVVNNAGSSDSGAILEEKDDTVEDLNIDDW